MWYKYIRNGYIILKLKLSHVIYTYFLGVEKLVGVYRERPNFADQEAQEDAKQRLNQVCTNVVVEW